MSSPGTSMFHKTIGYLKNNATEILKVVGTGPAVVIAAQDITSQGGSSTPANDAMGRTNAVVSAWKINAAGTVGRAIPSTTSTAITDEHNIAPHGDGTTLIFTGTIVNTPVVPKSVAIHNDAAPTVIIAYDGGDGYFYTNDTDLDRCGTIDYFTGAMTFSFPVGKAPAVGELDQGYLYEDAVLRPFGRKVYIYNGLSPSEILVVNGACAGTDVDSKPSMSTLVHTYIVLTGDATSMSP